MNTLNIWSPLGDGYGAYSQIQLIQVDVMKCKLGSKFDYNQCIDSNKFLDPEKLDIYAKKNGMNIQKITTNHAVTLESVYENSEK